MKKLLIISYLFPLLAFGQQEKSLILKLSTGDCRKNQSVRIGYRDTIQFFQNNKLVTQVIPMKYHQWPIEVENFKSGTYQVFYRNLYDKKVSKFIVITDTTSKYQLSLCPDELQDYSFNSLAELQNKDSIKIIYSSSGCFNQDRECLVISRQSNLFIAKLTTQSFDGKTKTRFVTLNQSAINSFKRFENEIRQVKNSNGCTTVDTYTMISKSWVIKLTDGGCAWEGFYFLKKALFGKQNN